MDNESKLLKAIKESKEPFLNKDTIAIHYGDCTWINKQRMLRDLEELKEKILTYRDLYVIDQLIKKIEKL